MDFDCDNYDYVYPSEKDPTPTIPTSRESSSMHQHIRRFHAFLMAACFLVGCGKNPEPEVTQSPQTETPKIVQRPSEPVQQKAIGLGEAKFKLTVADFVTELDKSGEATMMSRYSGSTIELEGAVQRVSEERGQTLIQLMQVGTVGNIHSSQVKSWGCVLSTPEHSSRFVITQRLRIKCFFVPQTMNLARCEIIERGKDEAIRLTALELAKAANTDKDGARKKYSNRAAVLTGVIVGKKQNFGGAECIELAGEGATPILAYPSREYTSDLNNPSIGKPVILTGEVRETYGGDFPYVLWHYWHVSEQKP